MNPVLKIQPKEIKSISLRYQYTTNENELIELKSEILKRRYLTKNELHQVAYWKSPRSSGHVKNNSEGFVNEITRFAFTTPDERARIESLTLLDGVSWPSASVILHLFHNDQYPILDFRALWSVSIDVPLQYNFDFWGRYVEYCRKISRDLKIDMRSLDRALWQYSKENQKNKKNPNRRE
jgi:hypothetical protein